MNMILRHNAELSKYVQAKITFNIDHGNPRWVFRLTRMSLASGIIPIDFMIRRALVDDFRMDR